MWDKAGIRRQEEKNVNLNFYSGLQRLQNGYIALILVFQITKRYIRSLPTVYKRPPILRVNAGSIECKVSWYNVCKTPHWEEKTHTTSVLYHEKKNAVREH